MPKAGVCYNKKELKANMKKSWLMGAMADRMAYAQPDFGGYGQPGLANYGQPNILNYGQPGLLNYGQPGLSSYGTTMFPQRAAMPLVGSSRRIPSLRRRISSANLFNNSPLYYSDPKYVTSLESLMGNIEQEMYSQEEKAHQSCVEGEESAIYRYQALSDLLADAADAYDNASRNPSYALELPRIVAVIKSRFNHARSGKLSNYQQSPILF